MAKPTIKDMERECDYWKGEYSKLRENNNNLKDSYIRQSKKLEKLQDEVDGLRRVHLEDQRSIAEAYGWINCKLGRMPNGGEQSAGPDQGEDFVEQDFRRSMGLAG